MIIWVFFFPKLEKNFIQYTCQFQMKYLPFVKISKLCILTLFIYLTLASYYSFYSPGIHVDIWHGLLPIVCRNHHRRPHGIPRSNPFLLGFYGCIFSNSSCKQKMVVSTLIIHTTNITCEKKVLIKTLLNLK